MWIKSQVNKLEKIIWDLEETISIKIICKIKMFSLGSQKDYT